VHDLRAQRRVKGGGSSLTGGSTGALKSSFDRPPPRLFALSVPNSELSFYMDPHPFTRSHSTLDSPQPTFPASCCLHAYLGSPLSISHSWFVGLTLLLSLRPSLSLSLSLSFCNPRGGLPAPATRAEPRGPAQLCRRVHAFRSKRDLASRGGAGVRLRCGWRQVPRRPLWPEHGEEEGGPLAQRVHYARPGAGSVPHCLPLPPRPQKGERKASENNTAAQNDEGDDVVA